MFIQTYTVKLQQLTTVSFDIYFYLDNKFELYELQQKPLWTKRKTELYSGIMTKAGYTSWW